MICVVMLFTVQYFEEIHGFGIFASNMFVKNKQNLVIKILFYIISSIYGDVIILFQAQLYVKNSDFFGVMLSSKILILCEKQ